MIKRFYFFKERSMFCQFMMNDVICRHPARKESEARSIKHIKLCLVCQLRELDSSIPFTGSKYHCLHSHVI